MWYMADSRCSQPLDLDGEFISHEDKPTFVNEDFLWAHVRKNRIEFVKSVKVKDVEKKGPLL